MTGNVTDRNLMLEHQGKRVLVAKEDGSRHWALTIVHVVDGDKHELRLANRDSKDHKPDWPLRQAMWESIEPAEPNKLNCDYEVTIK